VFFILEFDNVKDKDKEKDKKKSSDKKSTDKSTGKVAKEKKKPENVLSAIKSEASKDSAFISFVELETPPEYKIKEWLVTTVSSVVGRKITADGAAHIVELVGTDPGNLYAELNKIDISLPEKALIDKRAVQAVIGASREMSPFELTKALGNKNLARTLEITESLFSDSAEPVMLISVIFSHFWKMFKIRLAAESNREESNRYFKSSYTEKNSAAFLIARNAGILTDAEEKKTYPVMILSGIIDDAVKFKTNHYKMIFDMLRQFDSGIKSGTVKADKNSFQQLCYAIIRVDEMIKMEEVSL